MTALCFSASPGTAVERLSWKFSQTAHRHLWRQTQLFFYYSKMFFFPVIPISPSCPSVLFCCFLSRQWQEHAGWAEERDDKKYCELPQHQPAVWSFNMCDAALLWFKTHIHTDLPPHLPPSLIEQHPNIQNVPTQWLIVYYDMLTHWCQALLTNTKQLWESSPVYFNSPRMSPGLKLRAAHVHPPTCRDSPRGCRNSVMSCEQQIHAIFFHSQAYCWLLIRKGWNKGNCRTLWSSMVQRDANSKSQSGSLDSVISLQQSGLTGVTELPSRGASATHRAKVRVEERTHRPVRGEGPLNSCFVSNQNLTPLFMFTLSGYSMPSQCQVVVWKLGMTPSKQRSWPCGVAARVSAPWTAPERDASPQQYLIQDHGQLSRSGYN